MILFSPAKRWKFREKIEQVVVVKVISRLRLFDFLSQKKRPPEANSFKVNSMFLSQQLLKALIRDPAKAAGLHPNAIQNLKSGKTSDIKMTSFLKIAKAYGYTLELVKGKVHIPVTKVGTSKYTMAG